MQYKKSYFTLFSAVCDTIELLEQLSMEPERSESEKLLLQSQIDKLKTVQQQTEELLIAD